MRAAAVIVVGETGPNVRGETDVVVVSWIGSLQNIDKSLVFEHPKAKATAVPSVDVSKFTGLALWLRDVRSFYDSRPDGNGARFAQGLTDPKLRFGGPPPPLRGYGATSFACHKLAWFTEPKLAEVERRMVDLNIASWNQIAGWLRRLDLIRAAA